MSKRLDKSWIVLDSRLASERSRCVDFFLHPDQTYGFEEFRRNPEDAGVWTPVQYYSGLSFASEEEAVSAAKRVVNWLSN